MVSLILNGIIDIKCYKNKINTSKSFRKLFGEDEKKFHLVPNDIQILNGFKDIKWYHKYYLVPKILNGFKDIKWYHKYYLVPKILNGFKDIKWYHKY